MLLMQQHQDGLRRRLLVIGIPKYAINPFVDLLCKWENCSGVEWTIKRLKSLKVDLIRRRSGLQPLTWVKVNRKGDVAGTIGSLFRWSDVSEKNFSRAIQAFMAYSFYILPSLTEEQKEKFLSGINPEKDDGLDESFHKDFSNTIRRTIRERSIPVMDEPLVAYQGSSEKKAPRLFGRSSVKQNENILDDLLLFNTTGGLSLFKEFKDLYSPLLKGLGERQKYLNWIGSNPVPLGNYSVLGGEIHFLQENGGKLRSIASPLRIHQQALKPLGKELYRLIQLLPWDCTHDQTCAIPHIQSCLRQGGHVHSVDLSSATDHFPLSLQETALRAIFRRNFGSTLICLSRSLVRCGNLQLEIYPGRKANL
jgi:hypothetical protein